MNRQALQDGLYRKPTGLRRSEALGGSADGVHRLLVDVEGTLMCGLLLGAKNPVGTVRVDGDVVEADSVVPHEPFLVLVVSSESVFFFGEYATSNHSLLHIITHYYLVFL